MYTYYVQGFIILSYKLDSSIEYMGKYPEIKYINLRTSIYKERYRFQFEVVTKFLKNFLKYHLSPGSNGCNFIFPSINNLYTQKLTCVEINLILRY